MAKQTPLFDLHLQANAQMVDFAGWHMPLHYGSQIAEHHSVRQVAGIFDISHMGIVDVCGASARDFLRYLLANDIDKISNNNKALYACMLNEHGGVVDDVIVYRLNAEHYRIVCNAARFHDDLSWMHQFSTSFDSLHLQPRLDLAIIALQGPNAIQLLEWILPAAQLQAVAQLPLFSAYYADGRLYSHTGYTGESGIEFIVPHADAREIWQQLSQRGVQPCGLGARDTLRLEAGLNLYGHDMDINISPLESNLGWTICWQDRERKFIGRDELLAQQQQGVSRRLVGLILQPKGVLRAGQRVVTSQGDGIITSGSFSPTLEKAIAFARIPQAAQRVVKVERRSELLPAFIVKLPFVRFGKPVYQEET